MLPTATDALIVGAGPAGMAAAITLLHHGQDVTIVDSQAEGANTSRAAVVHARTLELLERYGVTPALTKRGLHTPLFTIRDRDRVLVPVAFDRLPTEYPYTLMISQADTESVMLTRLQELGGTVERPATVIGIEQDGESVTATFDDGQQIRAGYLVGADGAHSTVRERTEIAFTGGTYAESFVLADARLDGDVPSNEVILYFSPAGLLVVAPLPDGQHRIVATVDDAPENPDAEFVQRLLDERGPEAERAVVREVLWGSRFRLSHRVADTFRAGRVLLIGDAAHVHSPAGGQGMNLGIQDAVTLGEALTDVLKGASAERLGTWADEQRPIAEKVISMTDRLTTLATVGAGRRLFRNLLLGLGGHIPAVQRRLAIQLSGLDRR